MRRIILCIGLVAIVAALLWCANAWNTLKVNARTAKFNEDVENLFIALQKFKEHVGVYPVGSNADVVKALAGKNAKSVIILVGRKTRRTRRVNTSILGAHR